MYMEYTTILQLIIHVISEVVGILIRFIKDGNLTTLPASCGHLIWSPVIGQNQKAGKGHTI